MSGREGCHSCNKGVIKLSWASLVAAIKSTSDLKASPTWEESFITRVEVQYMITPPCFSWPALLLKLLIDPSSFKHMATCTLSPLPLHSLCRLSSLCAPLPPPEFHPSTTLPHFKCSFYSVCFTFPVNTHILLLEGWRQEQTPINRREKDTQMNQWHIFFRINQIK